MIETKKGSRARWRFRIVENDAPKDLTGYTATMRMRSETGALKINDATLTLADQGTNPGELTYVPTAGDVDTAGEFRLEIWVSTGGIPDRWPRSGYVRAVIQPTL